MPRQARLDTPGVLHHIMIRGIGGRKILVNDKDREDFLKRLGYDANRSAQRGAEIYEMDPSDFFSTGTQQRKVRARSLFCWCSVKQWSITLRILAKQWEIRPPAVGYCVERGEAIARESWYRLIE